MTRPVSETLKEYGRAAAGGLLFAVAVLYTMEIWWQGYTNAPPVVLAAFVGTLGLLVLYCHYAGLQETRTIRAAAFEAVETVALGFVITAVVLKLVGQLPPGISWYEGISRVAMVGAHTSIGVAVGTSQLGEGSDDERSDKKTSGRLRHTLALSFLGAILVGSSVAPTEEVLMIAVEAPAWAVLALAVLSFAVALGIVSYTNFRGSRQKGRQTAFAGGPWGDACVTYAIALAAAAMMLWTGGRLATVGPMAALNLIAILGLPCALGASAGRLLL